MAEPYRAIDPVPNSVRPPRRANIGHTHHEGWIDRATVEIINARNAAHSFAQNRRRVAKRPVISRLSFSTIPRFSIQAWLLRADASLQTPIKSSGISPRAFSRQDR